MQGNFNIKDLMEFNTLYASVKIEFDKHFDFLVHINVFLEINDKYPQCGQERNTAYAEKMIEMISTLEGSEVYLNNIKLRKARLESKISSMIKRAKELEEEFNELYK